MQVMNVKQSECGPGRSLAARRYPPSKDSSDNESFGRSFWICLARGTSPANGASSMILMIDNYD